MSLKKNLRKKIELDQLLKKLMASIKEPPGSVKLDLYLTQELLDQTDYQYKKIRDLQAYLRPLENKVLEIVVFDNDLSIYHSTIDDVAIRKNSTWHEMFDLQNIKKIMFDKDVRVSWGKASLKRLHANALDLLDLNYTDKDLAELLDDAYQGFSNNSISQIHENFEVFFELLAFEPVSFDIPGLDVEIFAQLKSSKGDEPKFENLIFLDEEKLTVNLKKGIFSPDSMTDLASINQLSLGNESPDLQGVAVFEFLSDLVLEKSRIKQNGIP